MSEKIGGAKGTELDEEFVEMERVCTVQFTGSKSIPDCWLVKVVSTTEIPRYIWRWILIKNDKHHVHLLKPVIMV